jgi:peptidyl-tRNA hydrolase, PTH1 family
MKLIVGLGNVGKRYLHTRHNIGFMVVEELLRLFQSGPDTSLNTQIYGLKVSDWKAESKLQAEVAKVELEDEVLILAKPQTMMNLSGDSVQRLMQKYRLKPADVWVIYDDVDVNFGRLRIRRGSSSGQQGIRSITDAIGSGFVQARMGISLNDRAVESSEIYVLRPFAPHEAEQLPRVIRSAAQVLARQVVSDSPTETTFDLLA